jgi:hypothetical protein
MVTDKFEFNGRLVLKNEQEFITSLACDYFYKEPRSLEMVNKDGISLEAWFGTNHPRHPDSICNKWVSRMNDGYMYHMDGGLDLGDRYIPTNSILYAFIHLCHSKEDTKTKESKTVFNTYSSQSMEKYINNIGWKS